MSRMRTWIRNTGGLWPCKFFLNFLNRAEPEEIGNYLGTLKSQSELVRKSVFEIVIFTEGSITLDEAWNMDQEDRELAVATFEEFLSAKNPKGKNQMKQENM